MKTASAVGLGLAIWAAGVGTSRGQAGGPIDFREMFLELDANADTVIDRDEVPERARDAFDRLVELGDEDGDGKLQAAEMRALGSRMRELGGPDGGDPEARFRAADKDGDGKLSRDEFPAPAALFDRIDLDGDNAISREEAARARGLTPAPPGPAPDRLRAMDKDGDGRINREEFVGPAPLFDRLDVNKDGVIGPDDNPNRQRPRPGDERRKPAKTETPRVTEEFGRLKAMDKDDDGAVSRDEFTGPAALFDRIDADGDGKIDGREAARLRQAGGAASRPRTGGAMRFRALDKDGDGELSRDEFPGPAEAFDRHDANGDGTLDRDEAAKLDEARDRRPETP